MQKAIIAAAQEDHHLDELKQLLLTAGVSTVAAVVQKRQSPHPTHYIGKGKIEEIRQLKLAHQATVLVCDDELSGAQERTLEEMLDIAVLDRTAVILDIFAQHAKSAEGKLQVELAQLEYNFARLRGMWTHLERLGAGRGVGGIGTRGPGESQIETDRRLARNRQAALRRKLAKLAKQRELRRQARQESNLPRIALAGYTNAGKTTLLSRITGAKARASNRLFETLDPLTRQYWFEEQAYLLTDTVGFIQKLPHQVVEAFHSTLEESADADLLLHLTDASMSGKDRQMQISAANAVLNQINPNLKQLQVWTKIDLLDDRDLEQLKVINPDAQFISAEKDIGIDDLKEEIARLTSNKEALQINIAYPDVEEYLGQLYRLDPALQLTNLKSGVKVKAHLTHLDKARFLKSYKARSIATKGA
jgi:GTPase